MPENEDTDSTKKTQNEEPTKFLKTPRTERMPYLQLYTVCGGIWIKHTPKISPNISIPAYEKFIITADDNVSAFYLKTNIAYPSKQKCIGVQFVLFTINVNSQELSEKETQEYSKIYEKAHTVLPPFAGVRSKFIRDFILSKEDEILEESSISKKVESITPFTAPIYLMRKTEEILNSFRNSSGNFDSKDLREKAKVWFESNLKFQYQNLSTFHPIQLTKQTLKLMLKTLQDIVNKKE